jgi:hypothetical protein
MTGIVGENAIDLHRMHIPFYRGCMEMRKRQLPALGIFGRVAQGLVGNAGAAGRGLGVIWNRSEHRFRVHFGQCRGGSVVSVHRHGAGIVDRNESRISAYNKDGRGGDADGMF